MFLRAPVVLLFLISRMGSVTPLAHKCSFSQQRHFLDCSSRGLTSVTARELNFSGTLHVDLSFNKISILQNHTFVNIKSLKSLDLSHNVIDNIESSAFSGLCELVSLNLSANSFTLTPDIFKEELFEPLVSLRIIQIQNYRKTKFLAWKGIDRAFSKLKSLSYLLMDFPPNFTFQSGFGALTNLTTIHAFGNIGSDDTKCTFGTLTNSTFEGLRNSPVKEIRLFRCGINSIELNAFEPLKLLSILDLTWNTGLGLPSALKSLYGLRDKIMSEIHLVMMNNSTCKGSYHLETADFAYLKTICVKTIDLSQNFVNSVDNVISPIFNLSCVEHLNISFHSFKCLPYSLLLPLVTASRLKTIDFSHAFSVPNIASYIVHSAGNSLRRETLYPSFSLPRNLESLNISALTYSIFLPQLSFVGESNMRILDISSNNIKNCNAFRILGLENLTHVDMSDTNCDNISSEFFSTISRLRNLSLSNSPNLKSSLTFLETPFTLLSFLEKIDLSDNKLSDLNPHIFDKNKHLKSVNLANNKFQRLPAAISEITELRDLDLSFNAFTHLLPHEMRILDRCLTRPSQPCHITLDENPLQCTCDSVLFIRWILQRKQYLDKNGNYACVLANGTQVSIFKFQQGLKNFEVTCVSQTYLTISVVGSLSLLIFVVVLAAVYRYRLNLRYWLYSKFQPPDNMFTGKEYAYDAFVAYTEEDYWWVYEQLCPKMEMADDPIKLCIHNRDFVPGKPIHENIVDKIRESRKILMIISRDFLGCTYGPLEIEYAGMKCVEEGKDDIILCLTMEDIPVRQMPKALRNLWHKITFLKWKNEPSDQIIFWSRLKEALH